MRWGDLVTIAVGGDYGKPRPALIVQSDAFDALPSVMVLRLTTHLRPVPLIRITIEPTPQNGLRSTSQVMIDKAVSVPRERVGSVIGKLDRSLMAEVGRALATFLDLHRAAEL